MTQYISRPKLDPIHALGYLGSSNVLVNNVTVGKIDVLQTHNLVLILTSRKIISSKIGSYDMGHPVKIDREKKLT